MESDQSDIESEQAGQPAASIHCSHCQATVRASYGQALTQESGTSQTDHNSEKPLPVEWEGYNTETPREWHSCSALEETGSNCLYDCTMSFVCR